MSIVDLKSSTKCEAKNLYFRRSGNFSRMVAFQVRLLSRETLSIHKGNYTKILKYWYISYRVYNRHVMLNKVYTYCNTVHINMEIYCTRNLSGKKNRSSLLYCKRYSSTSTTVLYCTVFSNSIFLTSTKS
jgi:hypothetical protein